MIIYSNCTDFHIEEPTVVSIGKFDGDHIGHQKIMSELRRVKHDKGYKICLFTFSIPPAEVVTCDRLPQLQISTALEKRQRFINEGIDYLIEYPFDETVSRIPGEDFIRDILVGKLNMKYIIAGTDCAFGYRRSGNAELLYRLSGIYGYEVSIIDKIKERNGLDISSSLIKELLSKGEVHKVRELLGHYYTIEGTVESGNHLGTGLGFPTVNIYPDPLKFLPKMGVYAVRIYEETGSTYYGMTNIGTNPTVRDDALSHTVRIETNIFDYSGDMYGKHICLELLEFVRCEKHFDSVDSLRKQLIKDREHVRKLLD